MKITIEKSVFKGVLAKVQGLTGRKSNLSISETVLIKTVDGGISLAATDTDTGYEGFFPAHLESEGIIAINSRKLFEIVRDFPVDVITLHEVDNRWIEIGNENVLYHIVGMDPDDFPAMPLIEETNFIEVDSAAFARMIDRTVFIAPTSEEKRPHINGVWFVLKDDEEGKRIEMVSTDGNRLSLVVYGLGEDVGLPEAEPVLVPKKALNEIRKFLDEEGTVALGIQDNKLIVRKGDRETATTRLLEGDFPDYGGVLKPEDGFNLVIMRRLFMMTLKRMSILSSEDYKGVLFSFSENKLAVTTSNPALGESKEEIDIEFDRDPLEIAINPKFLVDALNEIDDDKVVVHLTDEEKPCILWGENDKTFTSLVMPMRI